MVSCVPARGSAYQKIVGLYQRLGEDEKSLTLICNLGADTNVLIFTSVLDTTMLKFHAGNPSRKL